MCNLRYTFGEVLEGGQPPPTPVDPTSLLNIGYFRAEDITAVNPGQFASINVSNTDAGNMQGGTTMSISITGQSTQVGSLGYDSDGAFDISLGADPDNGNNADQMTTNICNWANAHSSGLYTASGSNGSWDLTANSTGAGIQIGLGVVQGINANSPNPANGTDDNPDNVPLIAWPQTQGGMTMVNDQGAQSPTKKLNRLNGFTTVTFDGNQNNFFIQNGDFFNVAAISLWVIAKVTGNGNAAGILSMFVDSGDGGNDPTLIEINLATDTGPIQAQNDATTGTIASVDGQWNIFGVDCDGTHMRLYDKNGLVTTIPLVTNFLMNNGYLAAKRRFSGLTDNANMEVVEVLFNNASYNTDALGLIQFWKNKYDI